MLNAGRPTGIQEQIDQIYEILEHLEQQMDNIGSVFKNMKDWGPLMGIMMARKVEGDMIEGQARDMLLERTKTALSVCIKEPAAVQRTRAYLVARKARELNWWPGDGNCYQHLFLLADKGALSPNDCEDILTILEGGE